MDSHQTIINGESIPLNQVLGHKIDICFFYSVIQLMESYKNKRSFYFFRTVLLVLGCISHLQFTSMDRYSEIYGKVLGLFVFLILSDGFRPIFYQYVLSTQLRNRQRVEEVAENIEHSKPITCENLLINNEDPTIKFSLRSTCPGLQVSKKVFLYKNNIHLIHITSTQKSTAMSTCIIEIQKQIGKSSFNSLTLKLSIVCTILTIYVLIQQEVSEQRLVVMLLMYLVSEIYSRKKFYGLVLVAALVVLLMPLFCVCFCGVGVYLCYFREQKEVRLPATQDASLELISKTQGMCSICYQNLVENEKVIVLKCSEMHTFHENCIETWSKKKPNCPICRADIE